MWATSKTRMSPVAYIFVDKFSQECRNKIGGHIYIITETLERAKK